MSTPSDNFLFKFLYPRGLSITQGLSTLDIPSVSNKLNKFDLFSVTVTKNKSLFLQAGDVSARYDNRAVRFNFGNQVTSIGAPKPFALADPDPYCPDSFEFFGTLATPFYDPVSPLPDPSTVATPDSLGFFSGVIKVPYCLRRFDFTYSPISTQYSFNGVYSLDSAYNITGPTASHFSPLSSTIINSLPTFTFLSPSQLLEMQQYPHNLQVVVNWERILWTLDLNVPPDSIPAWSDLSPSLVGSVVATYPYSTDVTDSIGYIVKGDVIYTC